MAYDTDKLDDYKNLVLNEYKQHNAEPVFVPFEDEMLPIPFCYEGDLDAFYDDATAFQDFYIDEYKKYNQKHKDNPVKIPKKIVYHQANLIMPLKIALSDKSEIEKIALTKRLYELQLREALVDATQKVKIARQEYPNENYLISLNEKDLKLYDILHHKHEVLAQNRLKTQNSPNTEKITKEKPTSDKKKSPTPQNAGFMRKKSGKSIKEWSFRNGVKAVLWGGKHVLNTVVGTAALPLAITYRLLDKKYNFKDNSFTRFMHKKALPYVESGTKKAALVGALALGLHTIPKNSAKDNIQDTKYETLYQTNDAVDKMQEDALKNTDFSQFSHLPNVDLTKKYKITDKESFMQLYNDAFPLFVQSMMTSEILVLSPYSDNGITMNTICLGNYYYPENGDPESSHWVKLSDLIAQGKEFAETGTSAIALTKGWACSRDNGRVFNTMYESLKGAEITIPNFIAAQHITYNNEQQGFAFCKFVQKNYQDENACAQQIFNYTADNPKFTDGINKRRMHEYLIYKNHNDYVNKFVSLHVRQKADGNGGKCYTSSTTQISVEECRKFRIAAQNNDMETINKTYQNIMNYNELGSKSVYRIIKENGMDVGTLVNSNTSAFKKEFITYKLQNQTYDAGMKFYKNGEYIAAANSFHKTMALGYADTKLYGALATANYKMKFYDESIENCREILASGDIKDYPYANFMAGKAYLKLNNPDKGLLNIKIACEKEPDNQEYLNFYQSHFGNPTKSDTKIVSQVVTR